MPIQLYPDPGTLAAAAANHILRLAQSRLAATGTFSLVLSGGSTPAQTYQQLASLAQRDGFDGSNMQIYWGDERCVPPDHEQSNYRMAREALLEHIMVPQENLHRMACEPDPQAGAAAYEARLRAHFVDQTWPRFDLILLGLGEDGHTASLFPGTTILKEDQRWVAPVHVAALDS